MTELWTWDQADAVADYFSNQDASIREDISMQILKLQEEVGEVAQAFIGWTGQNTRKGITHSTDDIVAELVDVAITAMVGIATMSMLDGPQDDTFEYAREAADRVWERFQEHSGVSMSGMPGVSGVVSEDTNVTVISIGDVLTSSDPEPPGGTQVVDDATRPWSRDLDVVTNPNGAANWTRDDVDDTDPESWIHVAGNFGPVRIISVQLGR